jgi:hypothetical protein
MNRLFVRHCFIALLFLGFGIFAFSARPAAEHPFPMTPGTYWTYHGTVRWTSDTNRTSETKLTWRMEIRRFVQHGDISAAVISGFPSDLNWSDGHPEPSDSLLVESGSKFYFISGERTREALKRLEQPSDGLDDFFNDDDLILVWPLSQGQKYCDTDGMARPDHFYCWIVSSFRRNWSSGIVGVEHGDHDEFVLEYWTNPDNVQFAFVPGVGITKYAYHHHGTVADTELQLVEFHLFLGDHK